MKLPPGRVIPLIGLVLVLILLAWVLRGRVTSQVDSFASCASAGYPVRETSPPSCSDGRQTFLGPVTPAAQVPASDSVDFEILVTGDSGGTYPKRQEHITSQAEWQQYWRNVHSAVSPLPPVTPVNFSTSHVLALSEGPQMTGGYNLKITGITTGATGTTVFVTESIPTVTCDVTMAISNRYFIARTPKLTEPVSFRITTDHRQCAP